MTHNILYTLEETGPMPEIIDRFKTEHEHILRLLREAKDSHLGSEEGFEKLMAARDILLSHLDSEDREFYSALEKAAERDAQMRKTLDIFEQDMKEVSRAARELYDKHSGAPGGLEFIQKFGTFFMMLRDRIAKEENIFFPEYERLNG